MIRRLKIALLRRRLRCKDARARCHAVTRLAAVGGTRVMDDLARVVRTEAGAVRDAAVDALAATDDAAAVRVLAEALDAAGDWEQRRKLAEALSRSPCSAARESKLAARVAAVLDPPKPQPESSAPYAKGVADQALLGEAPQTPSPQAPAAQLHVLTLSPVRAVDDPLLRSEAIQKLQAELEEEQKKLKPTVEMRSSFPYHKGGSDSAMLSS